ncbi:MULTISPECIES: GntR family transcriptional regulator [unclassified Erysipelothrix]|uniref:GntR family transcriptional regulator n=1 Tax=unclassified Erysipelothrix TaxID=2624170 RepID=UPI001378D927|nr:MULTISPECIES: GntR family transcriptional regulator [unclassified Erysipelothrix]MBK2402612.1 GntR family transcriptional regulator [Erysipelothrix sp. strain 2 (EsS2-6-Brazil)]MBK2403662.1 GntR family transcriptional regulator [Erysipelothrix sp. strain 2 (EsS2-7-Brazil)]NBA01401.1 GntR family transcriptional regulator [Erysipelothrix rhusiopathiae]
MNIYIKTEYDLPIYEQIVVQIKQEIGNGTLKAHEAMPSIRFLAKELQVSVITTKRAYEELEKAGYLYTIPSKGSYVSELGKDKLYKDSVNSIQTHFDSILNIAKNADISKQDLINILEEAYEKQ